MKFAPEILAAFAAFTPPFDHPVISIFIKIAILKADLFIARNPEQK